MKTLLRYCVLLALGIASPAAADTSPYAGQESRAVKALSDEQVRDLLEGHGMGLAKAAELNGYPGPRHVLQLSSELRLSTAQAQAVATAYDRMHAAAQTLGAQIIEREAALEAAFAEGVVTQQSIAALTAEIAALQGELRALHLRAHLETKQILNEDQIALYNRLRGYAGNAGQAHQHE